MSEPDFESRNFGFDYEAARHQDKLVMQQELVEQLVEMRRVRMELRHVTWLTEKDIESIACACGVLDEYKQAIANQAQGGNNGINR